MSSASLARARDQLANTEGPLTWSQAAAADYDVGERAMREVALMMIAETAMVGDYESIEWHRWLCIACVRHERWAGVEVMRRERLTG